MYGAFADPEPLGGLPHGGAVFDDINSQLAGPLLNISLQAQTRSLSRYAPYICERTGEHAGIRGKQAPHPPGTSPDPDDFLIAAFDRQ